MEHVSTCMEIYIEMYKTLICVYIYIYVKYKTIELQKHLENMQTYVKYENILRNREQYKHIQKIKEYRKI